MLNDGNRNHPDSPEGVPAALDADEQRAVQRIVERIREMPVLPTTGALLVSALNDPEVDARRVGAIIARDPVVAAKTLRLANSAYFGIRNPITTLNHAISMLGIDTIRQMVFGFYFLDITLHSGKQGFDIDRFWRHSMACAFIAEALARRLGFQMVSAAEAYLAGLTHDIGKFLLFRADRALFAERRKRIQEPGVTPVMAERAIYGTDHATLGGWLARQWNLPLSLAECASLHHRALDVCINKEVVALVMAANRIAVDEGCSYEPGRAVDPLDPDAERILRNQIPGIHPEEGVLDRLRRMIDKSIEGMEQYLLSFEGAPHSSPDRPSRLEVEARRYEESRTPATATDAANPADRATADFRSIWLTLLLPGTVQIARGRRSRGGLMLLLYLAGIFLATVGFSLGEGVLGAGILTAGIAWIWGIADHLTSS